MKVSLLYIYICVCVCVCLCMCVCVCVNIYRNKIYFHVCVYIYAPSRGLSTLAKESATATRIMQS